MKTAKKIMQKALDAHADPYLAFLHFWNTPTECYTTSPAQLNRRKRTLLSMSNRLLKPEIPIGVYKSQNDNQAKQAFYYDKTAKDPKALSDGDVVRMKPQDTDKKFIKAKVEKQVNIRSFRRNRKDLHKTPEDYNTYDNTLKDSPLIQKKQPQIALTTTRKAPTITTTSTNEPIVTRAGRVLRKPSHLRDHVTS